MDPNPKTQKPDTRPLAEIEMFEEPFSPRLTHLMSQLPETQRDSQQWRALLLIFISVPRLQSCISAYIDFPTGEVDIPGFWDRMFGYLSFTETFLAALAFHLYNPQNALPTDGLNRMRHLDIRNLELALAAIRVAMA